MAAREPGNEGVLVGRRSVRTHKGDFPYAAEGEGMGDDFGGLTLQQT